jgi:hypothetical protein
LLAQIFGEPDEAADRVAASPRPAIPAETQPAEIVAESETSANPTEAAPNGEDGGDHQPATTSGASATEVVSLQTDFVQRTNNIAMQNSHSKNQLVEPKLRRQHGRALPE